MALSESPSPRAVGDRITALAQRTRGVRLANLGSDLACEQAMGRWESVDLASWPSTGAPIRPWFPSKLVQPEVVQLLAAEGELSMSEAVSIEVHRRRGVIRLSHARRLVRGLARMTPKGYRASEEDALMAVAEKAGRLHGATADDGAGDNPVDLDPDVVEVDGHTEPFSGKCRPGCTGENCKHHGGGGWEGEQPQQQEERISLVEMAGGGEGKEGEEQEGEGEEDSEEEGEEEEEESERPLKRDGKANFSKISKVLSAGTSEDDKNIRKLVAEMLRTHDPLIDWFDKLFGVLQVGNGMDVSPRISPKRLMREKVSHRLQLSRARRLELMRRPTLMLVDTSPSCSYSADTTTAAAVALATRDPNIIVVQHSNGFCIRAMGSHPLVKRFYKWWSMLLSTGDKPFDPKKMTGELSVQVLPGTRDNLASAVGPGFLECRRIRNSNYSGLSVAQRQAIGHVEEFHLNWGWLIKSPIQKVDLAGVVILGDWDAAGWYGVFVDNYNTIWLDALGGRIDRPEYVTRWNSPITTPRDTMLAEYHHNSSGFNGRSVGSVVAVTGQLTGFRRPPLYHYRGVVDRPSIIEAVRRIVYTKDRRTAGHRKG